MSYKSSPRGARPVSLIAVHTAEGARTKESLGSYFWRDDIQASSHVGIDAGGVAQYVPYDRAAWTIRSGNPVTDNAELCGFARWTREQWLSTGSVDGCANPRQMLSQTAAWIRARCLARGIPITKLSVAELGLGHWGVIGHADWTQATGDGTHWDPGGGFPWDVVIREAQGTVSTPTTTTPKEDDIVGLMTVQLPPCETVDGELQGRWASIAVPPVRASKAVPAGTGEAWLYLSRAQHDVVINALYAINQQGGQYEPLTDQAGRRWWEITIHENDYFGIYLPTNTHKVDLKYTSDIPLSVTLETFRGQ